MAKWVLDAYVMGDWAFLAIYNEDSGSIENIQVDLNFYGYISCRETWRLVEELRSVEGIEDAWVEEWRAPPYYESKIPLAVFKTRRFRVLKEVLSIARVKGLRVVNTYPHPLVEALYRGEVRPLVPIKQLGKHSVEVEEWNPRRGDPRLEYVVVGLEDGYYVIKTPQGSARFWRVEELAEAITSMRFHVGFTDPYIYAKIIEAEPRVVATAYRWVTGGSYSPHEYFEWSRLSYTPLSLMSNITIGRVLTTIEALHARDKKLIADRSTGRREPWRSLKELLLHDRGGVVYQPKPGLYWGVCQVDFKSLYPSIMVKYNVSGETVDRPSCKDALSPPWTLHTICLDEEGVVPASIKGLLELKDIYDELYKETKLELYTAKKSAVKWILVASFGYLGYRNSLFGSVTAHEVVTGTSREIMRRAKLAAEILGFRVIHAIVDSLFTTGAVSTEDCECLKEEIERATGFKSKVEAHYTWLYIPRSHKGSEGVANRYYGLLSDGSCKVKGVLSARRDIPPIVKRAQLEALSRLFEARSPSELLMKLEEANNIIDKYIDLVRAGNVDQRELVIVRESRTRVGYEKPPLYALRSKPPYRLIYFNNHLIPVEEAGKGGYDAEKYIELLEKARRELPSIEDVIMSTDTAKASITMNTTLI